MNIFINISHPAHVHFFKHTIRHLCLNNHKVIIGARDKEFTKILLDSYGLKYELLTSKGKGVFGLAKELIFQQLLLYRLIKKHRFDLMMQIGGIFNAPIGRLCKIPTIAISDTENDTIGNYISFSLSRHVLLPSCFDNQIGGRWQKETRYPGYHELAYLTPDLFPERPGYQDKFLVRFVGWAAGHDIGEKYLTDEQKIALVLTLEKHGEVFVSSEMPLPVRLERYAFNLHPSEIHMFMKDCKMIVGESATMASEAACLGIPAVFISNTGRGYTTEQDTKYGLIKHFTLSEWGQIIACVEEWARLDVAKIWQRKRKQMLKDKINVTEWLVDLIENYPKSLESPQNDIFERYLICAE